ncbi:MAG: TRAP transporter small permease [Desulfovibrio sp.]|nr:TRAP transporter small permease [Desulfovibrio sp.]
MLRFLETRFEEILGSILLAIMATIAFVNVIVRYCTSFSFAWTEEITVNFFVWITLLGAARAFRTGQHLAMNIVYQALPKNGRRACYVIGFIICLVFFGALFYTGVLEVIDEYDLDAISESLGIPVWLYTVATPLFSLLIIFRILQRYFEQWRSGKL